MKPTQEEIQAEIKKLREMMPNVRHYTGFGDDNWAAIEAQIKVLEQDIDADDIYERWDMDDYLCENAMFARDWLDGEAELPSGPNGWGSLVHD